jgi:hypothetical protein
MVLQWQAISLHLICSIAMGINRTLNKVRQRYYWLQARDNVEGWCEQCDICTASRGPRTRNQGHMHQYNVGAPF